MHTKFCFQSRLKIRQATSDLMHKWKSNIDMFLPGKRLPIYPCANSNRKDWRRKERL